MLSVFQQYPNAKKARCEATKDQPFNFPYQAPTALTRPRDQTARGGQASGKHKVNTHLTFKPATKHSTKKPERLLKSSFFVGLGQRFSAAASNKTRHYLHRCLLLRWKALGRLPGARKKAGGGARPGLRKGGQEGEKRVGTAQGWGRKGEAQRPEPSAPTRPGPPSPQDPARAPVTTRSLLPRFAQHRASRHATGARATGGGGGLGTASTSPTCRFHPMTHTPTAVWGRPSSPFRLTLIA